MSTCKVTNLNNLILQFGKYHNAASSWNITYRLSYTIIPSVCGCHVYTGSNAYSPAILNNVSATAFQGWFTNNEKGHMYWISIGY